MSEPRLIDVKNVEREIKKLLSDAPYFMAHMLRLIGKIPTVDAVPVVRCEKCLYASQYPNENGMYKCGGILTEDGDCFLIVKPDHFCAFGESRGKKMEGGNEE